jgi:hypothetical protein
VFQGFKDSPHSTSNDKISLAALILREYINARRAHFEPVLVIFKNWPGKAYLLCRKRWVCRPILGKKRSHNAGD